MGERLTLQGLAEKLERLQRDNSSERLQTLEREHERMRSENAPGCGTRWPH